MNIRIWSLEKEVLQICNKIKVLDFDVFSPGTYSCNEVELAQQSADCRLQDPMHLDMIELNKFDMENVNFCELFTISFKFCYQRLLFYKLTQDKIYAMFGLYKLWDGVCESIFLLLS